MKINVRVEEKAQYRHRADTREETEQNEKTSHSAEEGFAAHMTPAFGGPFFVLGPPRRALAMKKRGVRFHKFIEKHAEDNLSIVYATS